MTRLEAIKLAKKLGNDDKPWYESDISLLEALGLIKFDEPKKPVYVFKTKEGVEYKILNEFVRIET